jgi:hypothetical protein
LASTNVTKVEPTVPIKLVRAVFSSSQVELASVIAYLSSVSELATRVPAVPSANGMAAVKLLSAVPASPSAVSHKVYLEILASRSEPPSASTVPATVSVPLLAATSGSAAALASIASYLGPLSPLVPSLIYAS